MYKEREFEERRVLQTSAFVRYREHERRVLIHVHQESCSKSR